MVASSNMHPNPPPNNSDIKSRRSKCDIGWVDLGVLGKKCFDFFGLQETVSRNSYMTTGLYRYSLAQPAILPPAQHMRGTSKIGSFNLSISKIILDK